MVIRVNFNNRRKFISLGYDLSNIVDGEELLVNINHVSKTSNIKVTAICNYCQSENLIGLNKYYVNYNRNNKGFYSCYKCKDVEKKKTCLDKYGVDSFSKTKEFKETESIKWKGIQKGGEKGSKTMLEKYGVSSFFKLPEMREKNRLWMSSDEFKLKSKETLLIKYNVDSFSKTPEFKQIISDKKDLIIEKIKETFIKKYGVEWVSQTDNWKILYEENRESIVNKIKETCISRYGVTNVSKLQNIQDKISLTKENRGSIIPDRFLSDWNIYKRNVRKLTNRVNKKIYEHWDGYDYYDGEFIKGYFSYSPTNRLYPSIDHKISVYYGFLNNIPFEEIASIDNLCITKRFINSSKNKLIEEEFKKLI